MRARGLSFCPCASQEKFKEGKYANFVEVSAPRHWPLNEEREDLGAQTYARMVGGRIADLSRSNVQCVVLTGEDLTLEEVYAAVFENIWVSLATRRDPPSKRRVQWLSSRGGSFLRP